MKSDESPYLRLDRSIVTKQIVYCTKQSPSHRNNGKMTDGFTVQNRGGRKVIVRWIGPVEDENKNLNRYTSALQKNGYIVERMTEQNVEPNSKAQAEEQRARRNRELLVARKLKDRPESRRQRQRRRVES